MKHERMNKSKVFENETQTTDDDKWSVEGEIVSYVSIGSACMQYAT